MLIRLYVLFSVGEKKDVYRLFNNIKNYIMMMFDHFQIQNSNCLIRELVGYSDKLYKRKEKCHSSNFSELNQYIKFLNI